MKQAKSLIVLVVLVLLGIIGFYLFSSRGLTGYALADSESPQIILFAYERNGLAELYSYDGLNQNFTRLTQSNHHIRSASVSNNGRYIAFHYDTNNDFAPDNADDGIYRLDLSTGDLLRLNPEGNTCYAIAWSPDDTKLTCTDSTEIYLMDADGSDFRSLTNGSSPSWSADGTKILYMAGENGARRIESIVINDGTITILAELSEFDATSPTWSPDESMIAYAENIYDEWGGVTNQILKVWENGESRIVIDNMLRWEGFYWSATGDSLLLGACSYSLSGVELGCRAGYNKFDAVVYSPDEAYIAVLDRNRICLFPYSTENACTELPFAATSLVAWRP